MIDERLHFDQRRSVPSSQRTESQTAADDGCSGGIADSSGERR
jgi:hypothetical protein